MVGAGVVVTSLTKAALYPLVCKIRNLSVSKIKCWSTIVLVTLMLLSVLPRSVQATVLPEQRVDVLIPQYSGGGVDIKAPAILVRKNFAEKVSLKAEYLVDMVSGASIDVQVGASSYKEERKQIGITTDYLMDKTLLSLGYQTSEENDFAATTISFDVSQDFFGDLSTLSIGYSLGDDDIYHVSDAEFEEQAKRRYFRITWAQVLHKTLVANIAYEKITDEGFLNNPYRLVRYVSASSRGYSFESELYPHSRSSDTAAFRLKWYMPHQAALGLAYRYFDDSWGVLAQTTELNYVHSYSTHWLFMGKLRFYDQQAADFYRDLFSRSEQTNFRARDKELSDFRSVVIGAAVQYHFLLNNVSWLDRASISFKIDHMKFHYRNFRDLRVNSVAVGDEPLYAYSANVVRFALSVAY